MSDAAPAEDLHDAEHWRAGLYALIGRLFFEGPDSVLLAQLRVNASGGEGAEDTPLGLAWQQLVSASASADVVALQHEHAMLFVGVGKTPVTPFTSAYVPGVSPERHLLLLKQQLEQWGLASDAASTMPADHISGVCDTLRHLILRNESVVAQKNFFEKFIYSQGIAFCKKLIAAAPSHFYIEVAQFTQVFLAVEREGFDMISLPT
mgnify:CR=1 FL=1